jgi:hypothetical protein
MAAIHHLPARQITDTPSWVTMAHGEAGWLL